MSIFTLLHELIWLVSTSWREEPSSVPTNRELHVLDIKLYLAKLAKSVNQIQMHPTTFYSDIISSSDLILGVYMAAQWPSLSGE